MQTQISIPSPAITPAPLQTAAATLLPAPLSQLIQGLEHEALREAIGGVFSDLAVLLEYLYLIETDLRQNDMLKERTVPIFALVQEKTQGLLKFIETRALRTEGISEAVADALDSVAYAIGHELRRVFQTELVELAAIEQPPLIWARIDRAHGLLCNCFQQSTIVLAQVFAPSLDGARLFNDCQLRCEQSLALRSDLWTLIQLVQRAEKESASSLPSTNRLIHHLQDFHDGSMRYLMYKDWETFEHFIEEVIAARGAAQINAVLHSLACYLQTLFYHVGMRAVLANHPFDFSSVEL